MLFAVVTGSSLLLFAWRAPKIGMGGRFALLSRESLLLTNNVLLVVDTGAVILGTLYPLILDSLGLGKQIGRANDCTPVTNANIVCSLLLAKKKHQQLALHYH